MAKQTLLFMLCYFGFSTGTVVAAMDANEIGWYWNGSVDHDKKPTKSAAIAQPASDQEVDAKISIVQQNIKHALRRAYLDPTPENIYQYKMLQDQATEQANQFANSWKKMLLLHPELDYSLTHPTNSVGLQVYQDHASSEKEKLIAEFAKSSGLFFFYRSTCPYCRRFAPQLKNFAERYHITVVPITLDGIALPEFPDSHTDQGQAEKFHVTVEPSLFAVNPYTQKAYPVAYGLVSEEELGNNIVNILTNYQGVSA